jgi:hypothetical protein
MSNPNLPSRMTLSRVLCIFLKHFLFVILFYLLYETTLFCYFVILFVNPYLLFVNLLYVFRHE